MSSILERMMRRHSRPRFSSLLARCWISTFEPCATAGTCQFPPKKEQKPAGCPRIPANSVSASTTVARNTRKLPRKLLHTPTLKCPTVTRRSSSRTVLNRGRRSSRDGTQAACRSGQRRLPDCRRCTAGNRGCVAGPST